MFRHFWRLPELAIILNRPRRRIAMTPSEVRRGVPRSPNRYLYQFGVLWQFDFGRGKIKPDRLFDILARIGFRFASRCAPRQFRAHGRPAFRNGVIFKDYSELHRTSVFWLAYFLRARSVTLSFGQSHLNSHGG